MVASSGLIARDRTTMPNIYPIGWYLFDASARFLAILICPQRVIDISRMIVCTTQRFYLKIAGRCRSESHHYLPRWYGCIREVLYPFQSLNEEDGSVQEGLKKGSPLFSWKLFLRKTALFSLHKILHVPSKYSSVQHRSSIEQQMTLAAAADEETNLFVGNALEFSWKVFPPSSQEHQWRRSRLTCCRITRSTLSSSVHSRIHST